MNLFAKWFLLAVCFWCTCKPAHGVIFTTRCLKMEEDFNFNEAKYVGMWYEIRRLYDPSDSEQEDCVVMNYKAGEKGRYDILQSYQITAEGSPVYVSGAAEPQVFENSKVPKFVERFNTTKNEDPDDHLEIVAIDYDHYAIVYSCMRVNETHFKETAQVLARETQLRKIDDDMIKIFLDQHFMRPEHKWRATHQTADFCKPSLVEQLGRQSSSSSDALLPAMVNLLAVLLLIRMLY